MPVAALLDPLVNLSTDFIDSAGLPGVFVLMALGSANIPVPSEVVMLFAGFNVSDGKMSMLGIIVAGVAGNMVGSWVSYGIGYFGRVELIERNKLIHLGPKQIAQADGWFKRYGDAAVFFTRLLPVVRAFISLPAGLARMPFWRFSLLTFLGSAPWVIGLAYLGRAVGPKWDEWHRRLGFLDYVVVVAIVALIVYAVIRWRRARREGEPEPEPEPASGSGL